MGFIFLIIFLYGIGIILYAVNWFIKMFGICQCVYKKDDTKNAKSKPKETRKFSSDNEKPAGLSYKQVFEQAEIIIIDNFSYNDTIYDNLALEGKATYSFLDALNITAEQFADEYTTEHWNNAFKEALSDYFDGAKCKLLSNGIFELIET